jgi:hypothetical protein
MLGWKISKSRVSKTKISGSTKAVMVSGQVHWESMKVDKKSVVDQFSLDMESSPTGGNQVGSPEPVRRNPKDSNNM